MSNKSETMAQLSRFVSVAVLTCLLMTGGLMLYHNRQAIVDSAKKPSINPVGWFLQANGVDTTRIRDDAVQNIMNEQKAFVPTNFQVDPDFIKSLNQPYQLDQDWNNR